MIRLLVLDVDGTLTDGGIYVDGAGNELKRFDIQDGMGLALLRRSSVKIAVISGRYSGATEYRAADLGIDIIFNGVDDKMEVLKKIAEDLDLCRDEIAYAGDDVNDIDCIKWSGLGIAVLNARASVKACADMVTSANGGYGAVREICEHIMSLNKGATDGECR